jgi:hypothetical protein
MSGGPSSAQFALNALPLNGSVVTLVHGTAPTGGDEQQDELFARTYQVAEALKSRSMPGSGNGREPTAAR